MKETTRAELRALRPALYHRFHGLLPFVATPLARRFWRLAGWLALAVYFAFAALILTLRYSVLPNIEHYRGDIEQMASRALGLPVKIGGITAGWAGLRPDLTLADVTISDLAGRPALAFSRVEAILSWTTLARRQLRLALLAIDEPVLHVRRNAEGGLEVAGIAIKADDGDSGVADWVLGQQRIRINGATLVWEDARRGAPPLILEDVNFALDNSGRHHRFGLTALPPAALASRIDVRGDLTGDDLAALDDWKGKLYTELDYVDLAGWQRWVDYPVALPRGQGAMRLWLSVAEGRLLDLTTDLALRDVRLQLARKLPELHLSTLSGRLGGKLRRGGFSASGRNVTLGLAHGTHIAPADFSVDWQASEDGRSTEGNATASHLDLQQLSELAAYLPLDARSRKLLDDYAPSGRISDLRLAFAGDADRLKTYSLQAGFSDLGLRAQGYFPGFFGLSGSLEASQTGGSVSLRSKRSGIDLPTVFAEPRVAFDTLSAQARWKIDGEVVNVDLSKVEFAGADAAGSAQGSYRFTGQGPGSIDLTAALTRARADAVWRYMPLVVNAEARSWLRRGITVGNASDARLTLKGDLAHFPFLDGAGTFLVTVKAHDVTVDYAPGWPLLEHIDGNLRFAGAGMRVDARRGSILGTRISDTVAEIPDFDSDQPLLKVRGKVEGPTAEFLRFIEASPVGESLEHATSDMRAAGNGKLDLALEVPLADTDATRVNGDFRFVDNQVTVDPALPPLTQVNGLLQFSDTAITIREIGGAFLGGPVKVKAETHNGRVDVQAAGTLSVAQARRFYDLPVFDRLSGTTGWRAEVKVKKSTAEVTVDTSLAGISSSLPPPFNKTANDSLPLHFEKGSLAAANNDKGVRRDSIRLSLGKLVGAQLMRRRDASEQWLPERGVVAVGASPLMPEKGFDVVVALPEFDADFWRGAFAGKRGATAAPEARAVDGGIKSLTPDRVQLRTPSLTLFGRRFRDVDLRARNTGGNWQLTLASREANGEAQYDPFGRGALRARLKQLTLEPPARGDIQEPAAVAGDSVDDELPALDVVAENFSVGEKKFGRVEVQAHFEAANWRIEKLSITNPDGRLDGTGLWRMQPPRQFALDFKLATEDSGALLARFGYPGALRRGTATLGGKLSWAGTPVRIDYPTLTGEMQIDAARGQFAKLDPGAAGKLLGLISLQSLPRRITLDFRDVFSEGFAYDSITGKTEVKAGVMHTDRLQIDGPSARVLMRGDVDLQNETQKLVVNVQPELGGTAALGVAVINPIAGAATLLAHKILQNPLNQIFSFDYGITGTWDDPKVEKLSTQRLGAQSGTVGEMGEAGK